MTTYKYNEVLPIDSYQSTAWLITFDNGNKMIAIWHHEAKIENVVEAIKVHYPNTKFEVNPISVGRFAINPVIMNYMANGRGVNQDMEVVVP
jgi:hypothetical protein